MTTSTYFCTSCGEPQPELGQFCTSCNIIDRNGKQRKLLAEDAAIVATGF
jgi:hypothetical protein